MAKIAQNRRVIQDKAEHGYYGDTFDALVKVVFTGAEEMLVSKGRSVDLILEGKRWEVKTGAGELGNVNKRACAGVSKIIYCPVFDCKGMEDLTPWEILFKQKAYILKRDTFIEVIKKAGLYRECKITTNSYRRDNQPNVHAIQTFWNRSKNLPHGKKYYDLVKLLDENCECTLKEYMTKMVEA